MGLSDSHWLAQVKQTAQQRAFSGKEHASAAGARFDQQLTNLNEARVRNAAPRTANQFLRNGKDAQR